MTTKDLHQHNSFKNIDEFIKSMPSKKTFDKRGDLTRNLFDGNRLAILWIFLHTTECVYNIAKLCNISSQLASSNLKTLKMAGIIVPERHGKEVYYHFSDTEDAKFLKSILEQLEKI